MNDLIVRFQNTIIEMLQNSRLSHEEFEILANLSENIEDRTVQDLVKNLTNEDLKDKDIRDCILEKHFMTALIIVGNESSAELEQMAAECAKQSFWEK